MPVISFASTKGGAGKTTSCLILAGEIAAEGLDVEIIDADPRKPIVAWSELPGKPERIRVTPNVGGSRTIMDEIDQAVTRAPWVLVDLEGMASLLAGYAMMKSDLVLIACQEQVQDAQAAMDTAAEIERVGQGRGRRIPHAIVVTRARAAVRGSVTRWVARQVAESGVPVLDPPIFEREAYAALYAHGGTVRDLTSLRTEKAIANAEAFAGSVSTFLARQKETA